MDISTLECLLAVGGQLSFSRAAAALFVSQSSLSRKIADLEEELGCELFLRSKPTLKITESGKVAIEYAQTIISAHHAMLERVKKLSRLESKTLHLGYINANQVEWIAELTRRMHTINPDLHVQLTRENLPRLREMFESGELDAFFDIRPAAEIQPTAGMRLFPSKLYVAMHKDHPLTKKEKLRMSDLADESFLMVHREQIPNVFDFFVNLCRSHGFEMNIGGYQNSIEEIIAAVASGQGIALADGYCRIYKTQDIVFV